MKRFIEVIQVHNPSLAYTIMEALEKNGYSVEYREEQPVSSSDGNVTFDIKVLLDEKFKPYTVGFCSDDPVKESTITEEHSNDSN